MNYKKYFSLIIILFVGFFVILDLFHPGLPITHDGKDHIFRIANFYENLKEGNIIPRWAANLNWGYGHPILEFLYPLPSYLASLFHFLGFSFIDSAKIVFGFGVISSGLFMFLWLSEFLGGEASLLGAVLYMIAPYRLVDLYVRGDIGEHLSFVFIPLVFYFLLKVSRKINFWDVAGGGFSLAFLILSHNAISLMLMPLILTYVFYLIWLSKNRKLLVVSYSFLIVLGFAISAFFWIPGLFEGKYTLRNILTAGSYLTRFVSLSSLLYGPWSYGGTGQFTMQLGVAQWISLLISPFVALFLRKKSKSNSLLTIILIVFTFLAILLMLPQSNFIWGKVVILQNFQFPWRFLGFIIFTTAVLGSLLIEVISKKFKLITVVIFILISLGISRNYWRANGYLNISDAIVSSIYNGTTDTGESSPIWSVRFMEERPKSHIEIIKGQANIKELKRNYANRIYKINAQSEVRLRENTLYFPGWNVYVDGKLTSIEFQDPQNRGLITFFTGKGEHLISIKFGETKLRLMSDVISGISLILVFLYSILNISKLWRRFR